MRKLFWGAAVAGGLYWASKQPGGLPGMFNRIQDKLKEVQSSPDPLGALKSQFAGGSIEPASTYSSLPEHQTTG